MRDVKAITEQALDSFWVAVATMVPEATTGDLGPDIVIQLTATAQDAVAAWLRYNDPTFDRCPELLDVLEQVAARWDQYDEQDAPALGERIRAVLAKTKGA